MLVFLRQIDDFLWNSGCHAVEFFFDQKDRFRHDEIDFDTLAGIAFEYNNSLTVHAICTYRNTTVAVFGWCNLSWSIAY